MTAGANFSGPMPESPCVGICLVDPGTGSCRGCLRTVAEIASWYEASAAEKLAILARLDQRQRGAGRRVG
jgi:uncharacterized protein